jgi:hypothetical protein
VDTPCCGDGDPHNMMMLLTLFLNVVHKVCSSNLLSWFGHISASFLIRSGGTSYKMSVSHIHRVTVQVHFMLLCLQWLDMIYFEFTFQLNWYSVQTSCSHIHEKDLPTPWSIVLLQKLRVTQLVKKYPTFYGTQSFITVFTRACHWSLFWARYVQSTPLHPISLRSSLTYRN